MAFEPDGVPAPTGAVLEHTGSQMPKYFFHVRDHDALIADQEGIELPGLEAVLEECRRIVREVLDEEQGRDDLTAGRRLKLSTS